ncbi:MAG: hypothetical protein F6K58_04870 [Symploca sp. SIO2E9]|nr:hypothetical protein [Symploca sp. SIO2E9]
MKSKTKANANAVRDALLAFPADELLDLIDNWLIRVGNQTGCTEWEDEARIALGYQLQDEDGGLVSSWEALNEAHGGEYDGCIDWVKPDAKKLYQHLELMPIEQFYHDIIGIAGHVVSGCGNPPSSYSDGYQFMEQLAEKLKLAAWKSDRPGLIASIVLCYP